MKKIALFLALLIPLFSFSQSNKKVLTTDDYASWNIMKNQAISNDGKVISYQLNPQKGDGTLIINKNKEEIKIACGESAKIGSESKYVVYHIKQAKDTIRKAKKDKVSKEKMPLDSLGIFVFDNDSAVVFPNLKSYKISEGQSSWIAFMLKPEKKKADKKEKSDQKSKEEKSKPKGKPKEAKGDDLVLFNVANADTILFHHVTDYTYAKNGRSIAFITERKDSINTYSSVNYFNTVTGTITQIFDAEGWAKKVVTDEDGEQFAFIHSKDTIDEKVYAVVYASAKDKSSDVIVDKNTQGVPLAWAPSENASLSFSKDGSKLFLGTALAPKPEPEDSLLAEEKPMLDVWNWKDMKLQPQQKVEASKEKKKTYKGVYHLDINRYVQLEDPNIERLRTIQKGNGRNALGADSKPYQRASSWTGKRNADYYLIDVKTGIKRLVMKDKGMVQLSPAGKFIVWYETADSSYYVQSTTLGETKEVSLTKIISVNFYEETNDMPIDPRPYGIAGWNAEDKYVYIYDRYDIWKIDPKGIRVPVNVTNAFGRRNLTRLRYVKLDREEEFIETGKPSLLSAYDERTLASGYFSIKFDAIKNPKLEMMDNYMFSGISKAKNADKVIWTKQNVETYPDLWCSNLNFQHAKKLSDANPQQGNYNWVDVEVVEWTSFTGETLRGLLYKPENLDPNKKYPMVVYFYERSIHTKNRHFVPSPSRSTINKAFYASNGYCVFVPDITYKVGYPGQSGYNAIVSGTNYLINKYPFIDKKKMALQGQSWGGYQTAYVITQTDMFAAAMAGAPVSNMTSAYGGIRWQTGMSRMFQYEHTQSRLGGTLWEKPMIYMENSPLFYAPKIKTPLLMMHNDNDGAVPWYQGIEFFVALRRLNKPVWLLSYNKEPHNLKAESWANRVDLSKRMFQFFNHYLKGEEAPEWMKKGVPAVDKGEKLGY